MELLDRVREFWDGRPCNIRHSSKPVGTQEYFDEVEARKYFVEPHIPGFAEFQRWKGKKVLEIGCGIGTDAVNFARHGADLTVVELSEKSLDICRTRFDVFGLTARFHSADAEQLSAVVPVETYDLIYSFGVIHHTPHPEEVFEEIKRYCGPETEVRVMLYSKWSWKTLWIILKYGNGAFWRAKELVRTHSEAESGCPVTHFYSLGSIRPLMRGYEIVAIQKEHIFPYEIEGYVNYQYQRVWYFRWMPGLLFRWLERNFGWHTLVVAKLARNR